MVDVYFSVTLAIGWNDRGGKGAWNIYGHHDTTMLEGMTKGMEENGIFGLGMS